ncbi:MAG: tRNA U-34 5-methylaminomethyl-2-thiouridine biosynthesis protein [Cyanobacteriota bacterium]
MEKGKIIAGVLAPHPPHLVYAENPKQNEPKSEGGWEILRWAYEKCRKNILAKKPDVLIVHSPHWQTIVGHHVLGLEKFKGLSVDPIFPHLFRYEYDLTVDVDLSLKIAEKAKEKGLITKVMKNPNFRIDYGTITTLHLMNPDWNIPIISLSSNNSPYYFSNEVGQKQMMILGQATKEAIEESGKKAVLLASNSLSHRHFVHEAEIPEDMSAEHVYNHSQYLWDMQVIKLMKEGKCQELLDILSEFIDMSAAEVKAGALAWMLSALDIPKYPAEVHGYGNVIGTGNAVVEWDTEKSFANLI